MTAVLGSRTVVVVVEEKEALTGVDWVSPPTFMAVPGFESP